MSIRQDKKTGTRKERQGSKTGKTGQLDRKRYRKHQEGGRWV